MPWGSKMLLSELRERVRQGFLEFAWRQWAQMGVSANIAGFDRWAIDPEALILFTIGVARRDPQPLLPPPPGITGIAQYQVNTAVVPAKPGADQDAGAEAQLL